VFAARRGESVEAMIAVRERRVVAMSRRRRDQFWVGEGGLACHVCFWGGMHCVFWDRQGEGGVTSGSLGSSEGWGISNILPVLSYFRALPSTASWRARSSLEERTRAVPGTSVVCVTSRIPRPMAVSRW
jgi:hypothetical protein